MHVVHVPATDALHALDELEHNNDPGELAHAAAIIRQLFHEPLELKADEVLKRHRLRLQRLIN